ncbi:hypothetical protein G6F31_013001 [Rhizopus arrhizus]|nr:hypothetical protein G6F31_013001 [Rhizopus arrhizus]
MYSVAELSNLYGARPWMPSAAQVRESAGRKSWRTPTSTSHHGDTLRPYSASSDDDSAIDVAADPAGRFPGLAVAALAIPVFKTVDQQQAVDLRRMFHRAMCDRREGGGAVGVGRDRDRLAGLGRCRRSVAHRGVVHRGMIHRGMIHRRRLRRTVIHLRVIHLRMIDLLGWRCRGFRRRVHRGHVMAGMRLREHRKCSRQAQGQQAGGKQ